ncbi:hypothetical protein [Paraburkholderia sp. JHI869]|uniref:hypothetical protein n=1 Tax=Paraburkholderia sp. JHI869 TaxID=3112959 RepID=UPI00317E2ED9
MDELIPCEVRNFVRRSPQLALSGGLFFGGILGLAYNVPAIAGSLFGAGATMLGAWIVLWNTQRASAEEKALRETEAKRYLTPELSRVVTRLLFVHQRALANIDFLPIMPVLYPSAPQFHNLRGDDAIALVELYDSLHVLVSTVTDWHGRESQQAINIFNVILHAVEQSMKQAQICVERFDFDDIYPTQHAAVGPISQRLATALKQSDQARENHNKRLEAEKNNVQKAQR